ncbi:MAG: hypothetical protein IJ572_05535 [Bacilli bacterium]|nr:hypothetical protein [Bacilli bacterium]
MNIFYTDNTLFVNVKDEINDKSVSKLKSRVFGILNDYDIENIVLNIISDNKNNILIEDFIREYNQRYHGNIMIK